MTHVRLPIEVVVVEDHDELRIELIDFLNASGLVARGAEDAIAMDEALRQRAADILLVDGNLYGEDGFSICRRMRDAFPDMGLVMVTARVLPADRTAGYQAGADVYLTKPVNADELMAVLHNLSSRIRRRVGNGLRLDIPMAKLTGGNSQSVELTQLEAQLLYALALAPDRKLSSDELLYRLDPDDTRNSLRDNMPVTISRLRTKIASRLGVPDAIKAVRGVGYQLMCAVSVRT